MRYKIKQGYSHSITEEIKLKQIYRDTVICDFYITKFNSFIIERGFYIMEIIINIIISGIIIFLYSCVMYSKGYEKGFKDSCDFNSDNNNIGINKNK